MNNLKFTGIEFTGSVIGFVLIAAWAFTIEPNAAKREKANAELIKEQLQEEVQEEVQEEHADQAERLETAITRAVSSVPDVKAKSEKPEHRENGSGEKLNFGFATELFDYARLKSKVLLSDEAKSQKESLLRNVDLLKALESLLKSTANDSRMQEMQNDAIDMLLEARKSAAGSEAELVLRSVIEDEQVENERVSPDARRSLAGVKAEVLYQWSAQDPKRADEMAKWLPGPVSEKIWANVVEAQNQNELASAEVNY